MSNEILSVFSSNSYGTMMIELETEKKS